MDTKDFNKYLANIRKEKYFDKLYAEYLPRVVNHIKGKFRDMRLAEDVAHECFVNLLNRKEGRYIDHPIGWLFKICDNIVFKKFGYCDEEIAKYEDALYTIENFDNQPFGEFQQFIESLDEETKKIFYLAYVEGYNLRESAERLKLNYDSVKKKHKRGIMKIKENFRKFVPKV